MRLIALAILVAAAAALPAARAAEPAVIDIWPEGVPGLHANAGPERVGPDNHISNVNHPSLTVFQPPAGKANGTAVIVCPGGGYYILAFNHEGLAVGRWFQSLGVTAFILKYRLTDYGQPAPLRDVLRAIRLVRSRAAEFGVDPRRIGALGFSAGGHLVGTAGTLYDDPSGRTGAPLDAVSARPDFLFLIYPVISMTGPYAHAGSRQALLGPHPSPEVLTHWSPELQVTAQTPPAFILSTDEDTGVPAENSMAFFEALRRHGVPAELHVFEHGPHGFGLGATQGPTGKWPELAANWMRLHGWLP
jgi:acetyl esterase/lipase